MLAIASAADLAGRGGSGDSPGITTGVTPASASAVVNYAPLAIDAGPLQVNATNTLYTTGTLCAAGGSTHCQTIDHVLVDSGSSGVRVLAEALGSGLNTADLTPVTDANGNSLVECVQFVDSYS
jgi:hypothetical protein